MERYVKVPVTFRHYADGVITAWMECTCPCLSDRECAHGSTEDEAFANLLEKLHYEEAE
jgi:hypothetical protein